ncbi:hypothetical protein, partial [uncultured Croceitalea sp.]|uniref:hypothetical protein n=1 Tax=uncultured Croceitalea sp. TaxID=1798908 RepID=UPI0033062D6A
MSKLSGHFLGAEPDDNVAVLLDDGSDELRWEFIPVGLSSALVRIKAGGPTVLSTDGGPDWEGGS